MLVANVEQYDVVVIGAGVAGMAAALFAAIRKAKVLLVEKTEYVGGTSALSAGSVWIPNTHLVKSQGTDDSPELALSYLQNVVGNRPGSEHREAFIANGPRAVAELSRNSEVQLRPYAYHPDYRSELPGAVLAGRALEPLPFDGRLLDKDFALIRPPLPEFTILGGMMVDRTDIGHLLNLTKSARSFVHAARLMARYARDRLSHGRGTRLVMGNALVGRLLYSLKTKGVDIAVNTTIECLELGDTGAVSTLVLRSASQRCRIKVFGGVVLSGGGFSRNQRRRKELLGSIPADWSAIAPGTTGDAQQCALDIGARLGEVGSTSAFLAPVSMRKRPDGSMAVFPHFVLDRGKPGTIIVGRSGKRFANEALSYHQFASAMLERPEERVPAYLITDSVALKRYGLGMVRPGGLGLKGYLADGYVLSGTTLDELAAQLDVDVSGLQSSVAQMNKAASTGTDVEFGRGSTAYQHNVGDKAAGFPNPNLGPIVSAPFYAVRLYPSDIGASVGLVTDTHGRVLGPADTPIPGLYACGNDMQSIMADTYPGPGITLGPAITFAYLAAEDAARRSRQTRASEE